MSLTIREFCVSNFRTGRCVSGQKPSDWVQTKYSYNLFSGATSSGTAVASMPNSLTDPTLSSFSKAGNNYIRIGGDRTDAISTDVLYVPDRLRFTFFGGQSRSQTMLLYAWTGKASADPTTLSWMVAFANLASQSPGDYIDVDLPDRTFYPSLYLALVFIENAWIHRQLRSRSTSRFAIRGDLPYSCIIPSYSTRNPGMARTLHGTAFNDRESIYTTYCVLYNDWERYLNDNDYCDAMIGLSSSFYDDLSTNDTRMNGP